MGKPIHFPYAEVYHRMEKKHPYYGKSMIIDFPVFPHTMGFVAFPRTVESLWGNPCSSHMMTSANFFVCIRWIFEFPLFDIVYQAFLVYFRMLQFS